MKRILGLAAALVLAAAPAWAQQFSADTVSHSGNGDRSGKIYVGDGKVRLEGVGGPGAMLIDPKANQTLVLMPQQKMYMDANAVMGGNPMAQIFAPIDPNNPCPRWQQIVKQTQHDAGEWSCKRAGTETVNGRTTYKYEGASSTGKHATVWVDPKLRFVIKAQGDEGGMELKNIVEGTQPATLFAIPADYRKMELPAGLQNMLQQRH